MNVDLIETAGPVMPARPLQHDPASRHAAVPLLQLRPRACAIEARTSGVRVPCLGNRSQPAFAWSFSQSHSLSELQCDMRQQIGLVASSSRVMPPKIHSPRRLCP